MPRPLPSGLLLGCATAAHQVEGGVDNDWTRWVRADPSVIKDGTDATVAIDHYRRFADDIAALGAMGHTAHRFSIEWARVEPHPGMFDAAALRHYREVVRACRAHGMEPIPTLHHFTLPAWLADSGGLLSPLAPRLFARYAAACAEALGGDVSWWLTINEPSVLAFMGYIQGAWPPQRRSFPQALTALRTLLLMHAAAAAALRRASGANSRTVRVSIAHHERPMHRGRRGSRLDAATALLPNWFFNRWFLQSCQRGRVLPPVGRSERVPGLADSLDYLGVNYYADETVRFDPGAPLMLFAHLEADPELPHSMYGWAIQPDGLKRALLDLWRRFRLPLMVTENGVSDDHDERRPQFIVDHLHAVADAISAGADVRGYLHWTAWDNFEWAEGYSQRFGLIAVDRETLQRTPKPSAALFADICRSHLLPDADRR